jgi:MFS family permease
MKINKNLYVFPCLLILLETAIYLSNDMYLPGLPTIAEEFKISNAIAQYTLVFWILGTGSLQLLIGPLSDWFGRKAFVLLGGAIFIISSFACAYVSQIGMFILFRFIQGSAASFVVVAGYAAIHESFDAKQAIKIISLLGSITILAPALGPIFGAIVIEHYGWREIFLILSYFGLAVFIALILGMKESNKQPTRMGIKKILASYFNVLCNLRFFVFVMPLYLTFIGLIAWIVETPFLIIDVYEKSVFYFGVMQVLVFGGFALGAYITRLLLEKISVSRIVSSGLIICLSGAMLLVIASTIFSNLTYFIASMVLSSLGTGISFGPLNRLAIDSSDEPMGIRMAMFSFLLSLSAVIGSVLLTFFTISMLNLSSLILIFAILATMTFFLGKKIGVAKRF